MRSGTAPDDRGVTLVELILAVALLGTAAVTLLGAFGTLVKTSDAGRKTGDLSTSLAATAEAVVDNGRNPYASCATTYDPTAGYTLPPTVRSATVTKVEYWDGTANAFSATTCHDADVPVWRLQRITLQLTTTDGRLTREITVVKRG